VATDLRAPDWRKSKNCDQSACVEVAATDAEVLMRNSTDPDGAILALDLAVFRDFIADVKDGRFDPPEDV
jgi:hypothetical protein